MDNDYVKISVEREQILIIASLSSISPQSEHNFFRSDQDVWCIANGLPTAIWQAVWVHSSLYSRHKTTAEFKVKVGFRVVVPVESELSSSYIHSFWWNCHF